jgi:uncharacterized repeat protein (TIGR03803 family)
MRERRHLSTFSLKLLSLAIAIATLLAVSAAHAQTFTVLHEFTGASDGGNPYAGVTLDARGNLYGTASSYYGQGNGTVYKLTLTGSTWVLDPIYSFTTVDDGRHPLAGVVFGPDGLLYGTTLGGGAQNGSGFGTVFKLRPAASACKTALCPWTEAALYSFLGTDGSQPAFGDPIFDQAGNSYGTTEEGGEEGVGVVYELTPSGGGWTESVLHSFGGSGDGAYPQNGLIFDGAGNLYGTTFAGGARCGIVFQLVPSDGNWTENVLYTFQNGADGCLAHTGLIFDRSGNLYGATGYGGAGGGGTVFELSPSGGGWVYSLLYSFTGMLTNDGCGPVGTLVMDTAGNLYGTTLCDGAYNLGSVFKLTRSSGGWIYTSLHDFIGGSDGGDPYSNVVFDAEGNLYGTAGAGGTSSQCTGGCGTIWEIAP